MGYNIIWSTKDHLLDINPLGQLSCLDFMEKAEYLPDTKHQIRSNSTQLVNSILVTCLFIGTTTSALRLLFKNARNIANWCCFIQSFGGVVLGVISTSSFLTSAATCRSTVIVAAFGLTTSSICVTVVLLIKAYAVQMHDRRLLWIGAVFMPPLFVPVWATLFQSDIYMADSGCTIEFPRYVPIFRAIIDIIINILFSAIFLKAVIKQYRAFGSKCWERLKADGIFYSIGVIASNIISSLLLVFEIFGPITQMVFLGDWILTSMLLIRQNASLSTAFTDNHPKTRQYSIMDQSTE